MPNQKFAKDSVTIMTEMVLPNDTNTLNNLMGGRLMHWMDIVAAIAAQKHCNRIVVTASADSISFKEPINLGNVVTLRSQVTRAFNSSMEELNARGHCRGYSCQQKNNDPSRILYFCSGRSKWQAH